MPEPMESSLRGKGLEIGRPRLRGSLLAGSVLEKTVEITPQVDEMDSKESVSYRHPEVFQDLIVTPMEDPARITYEIPDIGVLSLLKVDDYDGRSVLQVDIAEINDDKLGQGYGTDMYRYVANNLPSGYTGILSGTITNDAIRKIYENLARDPGFLLHKIGGDAKPALYLLEVVEQK